MLNRSISKRQDTKEIKEKKKPKRVARPENSEQKSKTNSVQSHSKSRNSSHASSHSGVHKKNAQNAIIKLGSADNISVKSSSSGGGTPRRFNKNIIKKKSIFEAASKIKSEVVKWTTGQSDLTVEEDSDERRGRMVGPLTEEERLKRV